MRENVMFDIEPSKKNEKPYELKMEDEFIEMLNKEIFSKVLEENNKPWESEDEEKESITK
jgi:hypothetical protein